MTHRQAKLPQCRKKIPRNLDMHMFDIELAPCLARLLGSLLCRTLSWLGWGLNRIAVGPKHCSGASTSGVVHVDNLVGR